MAEETVGGRYRLERRLRSGGFGHVWRARDLQLDVQVAVKQVQIPPGTPEDERDERLARAAREARNAAKLRDHPNVLPVHDVVDDDGTPWIVMRLVDGHSLADRLARGPLTVAEAAALAEGLLKALEAAHDADILHRDVKPDNVMLTEAGEVLLTDFGTAVHPSDKPVTMPGMLIGTPAYTAPERLLGEGDRPASDVFSLGATLYHAVEGTSPFHRDSGHIASLTAVLHEEPEPPGQAGTLAGLIMGMLEKDHELRPTVRQARKLLARAVADDAGKTEKLGPRGTRIERVAAPGEVPKEERPKTPKSKSGKGGGSKGKSSKSTPKAEVPKPPPQRAEPRRTPPPPRQTPPKPPPPKPTPPKPKPTPPKPDDNGWKPWMWWIVVGVGLLILGFITWGREARDAVAGDCVYYEEDDQTYYHEPCSMHWPSTGNYRVVLRLDGGGTCPDWYKPAYWSATEDDSGVMLCLESVDD